MQVAGSKFWLHTDTVQYATKISNYVRTFQSTFPDSTERFFDKQILDHFALSRIQYWSQRYFINDTFWTPGADEDEELVGSG